MAESCRDWLNPQNRVPLLAPVLGIDAAAGYEQVAAEGRKLYELIAHLVAAWNIFCYAVMH